MFQKKLLSTSIAVLATLGVSSVYAADQASSQDDEKIEEIVVTGIRASLSKALDIKRTNSQVVDSIVAEDIGKLPDNNVVEAMRHITGVQIGPKEKGEGTTVLIRGSGAVVTTINGHEVFTAAGRSMALADIPATMVAGIDVYKSTSADLLEGGIGGAINVRTHRPFDFDGSKLSFSGKLTYSDQSGETDPNVSFLASNRWETGMGEFGALINVSYSENHYREEGVWGGGILPYANDGSGALAYTGGQELSTADSSYSLMRDASGAWDRYGLNKRPAVNLALQWAPNDSVTAFLDAQYQGYEGEGNMSFLYTRVDSPLAPDTGYHYYEGTNVVSSVQVVNPFVLTSSQAYHAETEGYQVSSGVKWDVSDKLMLKTELDFQTNTYGGVSQILDLFSIAPGMDVVFNQNGAVSIDYGDYSLNSNDGVALGTYFDGRNRAHGEALSWSLDGKYQLDTTFIDRFDFGVRVSSHEAQNNNVQNSICNCWATSVNDSRLNGILDYTPGDFFAGDATMPRQWLTPSVDWLLDGENQDTLRSITGITDRFGKPYTGSPTYNPSEYFDITEDTVAAYVQAHYATEVAGMALDGLVGGRLVSTDSALNGNEIDEGAGTYKPLDMDSTDSTFLPNASARLSISENLQARLNYSKTITRPAFADLNPAMTLRKPIAGQIQRGSGSGGNPNLQPIESENLDVSLEWYFAPDSSLTGTLFRRDLSNTIVGDTSTITLDGIPYDISRPENRGESQYTGLEIGFQYFPDNLPSALDGFGLQSSYTYIDGHTKSSSTDAEADLVGVSKNSYSFALAYEKEKFGARISYVYRDGYVDGYNNCCSMPNEIVVADFGSTDISMSYNINDNLVITLDATNIFGDLYHDYFGDAKLFNRDTRRFSKTVSAGIRASF